MGHDGKNAARITLTVTADQKRELERVAEKLDVSVSWLLRRGAEMVLEANETGQPIGRVAADA